MRNCLKNCITFIEKNLYIIFPIITLFCLAGFIGSLIFPNEVLDTNVANMEESEQDVFFSLLENAEPVEVTYEMTTEERPLKGVQIGIHKNGGMLEGAHLLYSVSVKQEDGTYQRVSENSYDLGSQAYDFQYVYLPFSGSDLCMGEVKLTFSYEPGENTETAPALRMNATRLENTVTGYRVLGETKTVEGGLMISYIYSHNTYPFLYDFRILTFVFLAVTMTFSYRRGNFNFRSNQKTYHAEAHCGKEADVAMRPIARRKSRKRTALFAILFVFTLSVVLECLIFQFHAIINKEEPLVIKPAAEEQAEVVVEDGLAELTEEEVKAIRVEQENQKLLAEYNHEEYVEQVDETLVEKNGTLYRKIKQTTIEVTLPAAYYTHELKVECSLGEKGGYSVSAYMHDAPVKEAVYCSVNPKLNAGVTLINSSFDRFTVVLTTADEVDLDSISITLSNDFSLNWLRIAVMACGIGAVVWLAVSGQLLLDKPEWVFAVFAFAIGSLLIWGIGTNQVSFDEYAHAKKAYDFSFGTTIETTESAMQMKGNLLPFFYNRAERKLVEAYEQTNHDYSWADITYQSRFRRSEDRVYYPNSAGFFIGRKLGADFATTVALAKYGNLLLYIVVVFLAIKLADGFPMLVALIGLLPNNLFIASAISYDGVVTAFLLLATVLITNELLEPEKKITWKSALGILLAYVIGSLTKPVYIVMALMLVFLGRKKFENRFQETVFKLSVCIVAGLMLYAIFKPLPAAGGDYQLVGNSSFLGDKRNVGTSFGGQMSYILSNPLAYTKVLLSSMGGMLWDYLFGGDSFIGYAYLGFKSFLWTWLCLGAAFLTAMFWEKEEKRKTIGVKYILLNLLMIFGTSAIILTSMYVSYTPVGSDTIAGVQGRYFIPLFLPFFSCFFQNKWKLPVSRLWVNRIGFFLMAGLNLYMITDLVLIAMNL